MSLSQFQWETQRVFPGCSSNRKPVRRSTSAGDCPSHRQTAYRRTGGQRGTEPVRASPARLMELAAEAFTRAASAQANVPGGRIRVTSNQLPGVEVVPPMMHQIRAAQPQLALELSVSNRLEDLALQGADVAVRIRRLGEASVVVRHVGDLRVGLYATAGLLEHRGCLGA